MPPVVYYKLVQISSFAQLLGQPFDLRSPSRSTVPHLAYWYDFNNRLAEYGRILALPISPSDAVQLTFELEVPPFPDARAPSCTDLMIRAPQWAAANEAKYTEPCAETVQCWLRTPPQRSRQRVLDCWLRMIESACLARLEPQDVLQLPYQLIHRTASVCSLEARRRFVVYHCFGHPQEMLDYYKEVLGTLAAMLQPSPPTFVLLRSNVLKTDRYARLEADWRANRRADFTESVRGILLDNGVGTFNDDVVFRAN